MDYYCSQCGAKAYYDGRCGDGPILMCGCDKKGPPAVDTRCGYNVWYPAATAKPIPIETDRR
jgi:hypothetical protein